ncbi:MAG: hypothetical protein JSR33_12825 [Proteobacteria bacterium]|nr:hypothetical protein [Pseudomonadota bacterium]
MLQIEEKFKEYNLFQGGELYIRAPFLLEFIEECAKQNIAIIGIEGFKVINNQLEPKLDAIVDFSELTHADWETFKKIL